MGYKLFGMTAILLLLLGACRTPLGVLIGATDEAVTQPDLEPLPYFAQTITLSDLNSDPQQYSGEYVQLSGDLRRSPKIDCDTKARNSPASWLLADDDLTVSVGGSSQGLNQLLSGINGVTVAGHWLRWEGPIGCGRQTENEELWFLSVDQVTSPNPVAMVPVLIDPSAPEYTVTGQRPEPTSEFGDQPVPGDSSTPVPQGDRDTPTSTLIPLLVTPSETATVTSTPTIDLTTPEDLTPAKTPESFQPTETATQGAPDSTATLTTVTPPSTRSATPASTNTPTSTATVGAPQVIDQMVLDVSSIETGLLGTNETHRWPHVITATKTLTVQVASDLSLDVAIRILDPAGNTIAEQNASQNDRPEILGNVSLAEPGTYDILVSSPSGEPGNYAILISDDDSYLFFFQGTLDIGDGGSAVMIEESDHFWHFTGASGQVISINVVPDNDADLFLNLFGTDGVSLIRFHDETGSGEPEQIISYLLPDTGIYSLRIGEYNFGPAAYAIFLTEG